MSDLVGNPEDRFSRVAAHIEADYQYWVHISFFMLNSAEHEISIPHKYLNSSNKNEIFGLNHTSQYFILLINVKMPTIVGILTFISRTHVSFS